MTIEVSRRDCNKTRSHGSLGDEPQRNSSWRRSLTCFQFAHDDWDTRGDHVTASALKETT
jgi:hypothetical protein